MCRRCRKWRKKLRAYRSLCLCDIPRQKCPGNLVQFILQYTGIVRTLFHWQGRSTRRRLKVPSDGRKGRLHVQRYRGEIRQLQSLQIGWDCSRGDHEWIFITVHISHLISVDISRLISVNINHLMLYRNTIVIFVIMVPQRFHLYLV